MPNNFESKHDDCFEASTIFPNEHSVYNNLQPITFYNCFVRDNEHFQLIYWEIYKVSVNNH